MPPELAMQIPILKELLDAMNISRLEMEGFAGTEVRILYGGSVKPENAAGILRLDNVNGVLVGGASLKADSFSRIVLAQ